MPTPPQDLSRLGRAFAEKSAAPAGSPASQLVAALAGARPKLAISFAVNGHTVTGSLVLLGVGRELDIEAEVTAVMNERGMPETPETETAWELERALRVLADAAVDEKDVALGPLDLWRRITKETVVEIYRSYLGHAAAHDPAAVVLTDEEREAISRAIEKKSEALLRAFGARRLASFMTTTVTAPATSPTSKSSSGDSSPES